MNIRKSVTILAALALVVVFSMAAPVAQAADLIKAAVTSGATRLECLQNDDGGWDWGDVSGDPCPGGGPGPSPANTLGVTALGLLEAYRLTHTAAFKAAAVATGDALKAMVPATCATPDDRPVTANVLFLMELWKTTDPSYKTAAKDWFACITGDLTGKARADDRLNRRIGQGNDNLGGWDVAFDVRVALAIGGSAMKAYALAELKQVFARQADWDKETPAAGTAWEVLSKAHLLLAMRPVRNATTQINTKVNEFTIDLLTAQLPDGSWASSSDSTTQLTAYAVLALDSYPNALTKTAVKAGVDFLLSQQLPNDGFDDGTGAENTEVNSEVLQALKAAH